MSAIVSFTFFSAISIPIHIGRFELEHYPRLASIATHGPHAASRTAATIAPFFLGRGLLLYILSATRTVYLLRRFQIYHPYLPTFPNAPL
jgi:hypothetical protein